MVDACCLMGAGRPHPFAVVLLAEETRKVTAHLAERTGAVTGRWRLSRRTKLAVFDVIGRQWILGQALPRLVDFQLVAVFQDLNVLAFGSRHPIVIGAKGQVTVLVSAPTMVPIGRGQMGRQLGQ